MNRIAIVGIGGVFPGSKDLAAFWEMLRAGQSAAKEAPAGRWTLEGEEVIAQGVVADKVASGRACFVDDFEFDATGLDIDAGLLGKLDPVYRLGLAASVGAWKDAVSKGVDASRVGVVMGNIALPTEASSAMADEVFGEVFERELFGENPLGGWGDRGGGAMGAGVEGLNRYVTGLPGGLIAKALGLGGGTWTLDAACASSLYALKFASEELLAGRADAMLAGGLSRPDSLYTQMGFSQLGALSSTGVCSPFDQKADGLVVGEGAGMVVLKRVEDALAAGDHIYATIAGIGLSNDIGGSLFSPDSEGQLRAMRDAYGAADWAPGDVDHIECHGTGTPVGDGVEVASLKALFKPRSKKQNSGCVIGSVKSNVGHLLTAAGSAGLIKTLLGMRDGVMAPTANFKGAHEKLELGGSGFEVLSKERVWERQADRGRRAAVSAFGFGGINAHVLLEEWTEEQAVDASDEKLIESEQEAIAIVGMGTHVGPWKTLGEFGERVLGKGGDVEPTEPKHWWGAGSGHEVKGYWVDEVTAPMKRFRIPPAEMADMLPQQLLMLKVATEALDDAGLGEMETRRLETGVFIGLGLDLNTTNYHFRWGMAKRAKRWAEMLGRELSEAELAAWVEQLKEASFGALTANRTMGNLGGIVASRVARAFKVGGPSFTVSSEETSGLAALEAAAGALRRGELNVGIVGAVDLAGDIRAVLGQGSGAGARQWARKNKPGAVVGEGAVSLVLKRLSDAERDGDRVYGLLTGMGQAHGGGVDEATPTAQAYRQSLDRACAEAGIEQPAISMIETHSSGDTQEDAIEAEALSQWLDARDGAKVVIANVKKSVGYAGAASGLIGVAKAALSLHHRTIAQNDDRQYWLTDKVDGPRICAVAGMSVDGNCMHAILTENNPGVKSKSGSEVLASDDLSRGEGLFIVRGDDAAELTAGIDQLIAFSIQVGPIELLAKRWHESGESSAGELAIALIATNADQLVSLINEAQAAVQANTQCVGPRVFYSPAPLFAEANIPGGPGLGFVFPGSGNHFAGMGKAMGAAWPSVMRQLDDKNDRLESQFAEGDFWAGDDAKNLSHKDVIFGQVWLGALVSDVVRACGVEPNAAIGYSLGETTAQFATRSWTARDEMLTRLNESTLFTDDLSGRCESVRQAWGLNENEEVQWQVGVVNRSADAVNVAIEGHRRVYLLIVNSPGQCVIGGDRSAVAALVESMGASFHPVDGVTTVHSEVAKPVAEAYRDLHLFDVSPMKDVTYYSGVGEGAYEVTTESAADSILGQAVGPFDFTKVIEAAYADGVRVFIEMGPGSSCSRMIGDILGERPHAVRSACISGQDEVLSVLGAVAMAVTEGAAVDLNKLHEGVADLERVDDLGPMVTVPVGGERFIVPQPPPEIKIVAPVVQEVVAAQPVVPELEEVMTENAPLVNEIKTAKAATEVAGGIGVDSGALAPVINQMLAAEAAHGEAQEAFLRFSQGISQTLSDAIGFQTALITGGEIPAPVNIPVATASITAAPTAPVSRDAQALFGHDMCMEFAVGSVGKMLGETFAPADGYPTRVRLPDEPLMLAHRIMEIEGEPAGLMRGSLAGGRVITEHDVVEGAWYLDGGRIPTCIAVEAGQADLFLSGYLGIDLLSKGLAVYRLLDAAITFHDDLPGPGAIIRYDIRIHEFFHQGDTFLFRFGFEGTVNGKKLLTMEEGIAGFFTQEELDAGKGVVQTKMDLRTMPGKRPSDWANVVAMGDQVESYSEQQIDALRNGDYAACFGELFEGLALKTPVGLPGGGEGPDSRMRLVHRILKLDATGGRFGLGQVVGEADIHPDDWFLTCHFVDDRVMPGTLMYECCLHTLRVHLLRMGWIGEGDEVVYEPIIGVKSQLQCRGQVLETTQKVQYEITLKEVGYQDDGTPFVIADALMYADGKAVVQMKNMSARLTGLTKQRVEAIWQNQSSTSPAKSPVPASTSITTAPAPPIYDNASITAFAAGKPSDAFGDRYKIFDEERKIARLPRAPYKFLDRVTKIEHCEAWVLKAGGVIEAQYDVPSDEWYFDADRQGVMPFGILLEVALQPCGWLAGYLGSALTSETDISFRNLGGSATQYLPVTPDVGTLTTQVKMTNVSQSGGMIIQNYEMETWSAQGLVYKGDTYFGFFAKDALANQLGIQGAKPYEPTEAEWERGRARGGAFLYPDTAPYPDAMMRMVNDVELFDPAGGPNNLGFIRGTMEVDPGAWFFKAHFYQDPVVPGSLGLESMLQLLKLVATERWAPDSRPQDIQFEGLALGEKHQWVYRGQVVPKDNKVTVQAVVTKVDNGRQMLWADGYLMVDGRIIYHMKDFALRITTQS